MAASTSLHGGTSPLAALSTIFTFPCASSFVVTTTKTPSQYPTFPTAGATSCVPPSWPSNIALEGFAYYSPAICPSGFNVGPSCTLAGKTRTAEGFPGVASGETVAWCVPTGFTCTSDTTDFRGGIWGYSATGTAAAGATPAVTVAPAMQIRWRDVDLTALQTHPLQPGVTVGGSGNIVASSLAAATATAATSTPDATTTTTTPDANTATETQATVDNPSTDPATPTSTPTTAPTIGAFTTIPLFSETTTTPEFESVTTSMSLTTFATTSQMTIGTSVIIQTSYVTSSVLVATTLTAGGGSPTSSPAAAQSSSDGMPATTIAAVVLSSVFIAIALSVGTFLLYRARLREKSCFGRRPSGRRQVGLGVWIGRGPTPNESPLPPLPDERFGNDFITTPACLEKGAVELSNETRLGTSGNPAELADTDVGASRDRRSWMSRISDMFSIRSFRAVTLTTIQGERPNERLRSASSMTTMRTTYSSDRGSCDWETFAREKWPDGPGSAQPLAYPPPLRDKPAPALPSTPTSARSMPAGYPRSDAGARSPSTGPEGRTTPLRPGISASSRLSSLSAGTAGTFGALPTTPDLPDVAHLPKK